MAESYHGVIWLLLKGRLTITYGKNGFGGVLMFTADPTECFEVLKGGSMIHDNQRICRFRDASGRVYLGFLKMMGSSLPKEICSQCSNHPEMIPPDVFLLPPLYPQKIVGIGSNYLGHIKEMGRTSTLGSQNVPEAHQCSYWAKYRH